MNFLGHAAVAGWSALDPPWILGAMLPDFASMSRARIVGARDGRTAAGIAFHHETDDVFHAAPTFVALNDGGARELEARGVGRGPARAVAHVGTELLLDGLLLDDARVTRAYLDALAIDPAPLGLSYRGRPGAQAARFAELHARLRAHGLPETYRTVEGVTLRLGQTLARRPRLAWRPEDRPAIEAWLRETRRGLERSLPRLLGEVRDGLRGREPRTALG